MLQRAPIGRRYPILVALLHQSLIDVTDEIIELYDRCLGETYAKARWALAAYRLSISRSANQKVGLPVVYYANPKFRARIFSPCVTLME